MSPAIAGLVAQLALALHLLWILFVIFGGLLFLRFPRVRLVHLAGVGAALVLQLGGIACPLTWVEQECLGRSGRASYEGSFVAHYLEQVVYPAVPYEWITALTVLLLIVTVGLLVLRPLDFSPNSPTTQ